MRFVASILFTLFASLVIAQTNPGLTYGGQKNDIGYSLCHTPEGGYILAGNTRSYGSGSNDIFLIKLNENYQNEWTVTYGWEHQDFVRKVIPFNGGYAIIGNIWGLIPVHTIFICNYLIMRVSK
jgi:hypothetical protein